MTNENTEQTQPTNTKDYTATLLLVALLGPLGIHRFYTGYIGIGIIQLLTLGGCGLWGIIDLIFILCNRYNDAKGQPLANYNQTIVYIVIGIIGLILISGVAGGITINS